MIKYFCCLLLLFQTCTTSAQELIEPCKSGQPLVTFLQNEYVATTPLSYGDARDILYSMIEGEDFRLSGIYTNYTILLDPSEDPSKSAFDQGINAEHVYPQSLGAGGEPAKSDMHNIFPSRVNVNSSRGNCPFGEIVDEETDTWYFEDMSSSTIPSNNIDAYSEKISGCVFEPREMVKGDIARAIFYFFTIHHTTADKDFFEQQKEILYQWHQNDPVTERELRRDSLIHWYQGNHNPFVLDPTLVKRAYFLADGNYEEGDPNCFTTSISMQGEKNKEQWVDVFFNSMDQMIYTKSNTQKGNIYLIDSRGIVLERKLLAFENNIPLHKYPQGVYILLVKTKDKQQSFRFFNQ